MLHILAGYDDKERLMMLFVLIILSVFSIGGNITQFIAIYLEPSLQTASNIFIISLGCSDLGVGIITLPTVALTVRNRAWILGDFFCQLAGMLDSIFITASMWTLGFTALDRYFLVQSPISHRNWMNKNIARRTVFFCWGLSVACAIFPVLGWSEYSFSSHSMSCAMTFVTGFESIHKYYFLFYVLVSFPVPLGMIVVCYIRIGFSVTKKSRERQVTLSSPTAQTDGCRSIVILSNIRTAKITLLLILFVLACILPTFVVGMMFWFEQTIPFAHQTSKAVIWSLLGNSALNPVLYGWFNKHFRSVYQHMILAIILRERYSTLKRSMMSMRSVHGTPKSSFHHNPVLMDVMEIIGPTFGNSLRHIKNYSSKLNYGARSSLPVDSTRTRFPCISQVGVLNQTRRHSVGGEIISPPADTSLPYKGRHRSQPDIYQWHLTTRTHHM